MKTASFSSLLVALIFLLQNTICRADIISFSAIDRGWYQPRGAHFSDNLNTTTGQLNGTFNPGQVIIHYNSFFQFDLSILSPSVIESAQIRLEVEGYNSIDTSEVIQLYSVSTLHSELVMNRPFNDGPAQDVGEVIYSDLQNGTLYGSGVISSNNVGQVIELTLTPEALGDVRNSAGGLFAIGVHIPSISSTIQNESIRFSLGSESRTHELVITLVPEPNSAILLVIGGTLILKLIRNRTKKSIRT